MLMNALQGSYASSLEEIEKLKSDLISERDYQKLQNKFENRFVNSNSSVEGIANSLVVEFDTYQNSGVYNDPWHDHIAILKNGIAHHSSGSNLAGPVQPTSTLTNMEDGVDHNVKIVWTAATQTFEVFFDCELRLTLTQDIKNTIFELFVWKFFGVVF